MPFKNLTTKNIILASASPRRKELLEKLNIPFTIIIKEVEENYNSFLKEEKITTYLAKLKASAFKNLSEKDVIITADTIVWHNNKALEKPKNKQEAFNMLASISGTTHKVISSICIKTKKEQKTISDVTKVTFKTLTTKEINYYIKQYKPYDKAGAYGIQDWIGLAAIKKIKGSYFNVMGLPVHKLYQELLKL